MKAYSDADFTGSLVDRHSFTEMVVTIGNNRISWRATKQKCIALSTMESEFIALFETAKELAWLRRILEGLNLENVCPKLITIQIVTIVQPFRVVAHIRRIMEVRTLIRVISM